MICNFHNGWRTHRKEETLKKKQKIFLKFEGFMTGNKITVSYHWNKIPISDTLLNT
jgi:hypothetical protein